MTGNLTLFVRDNATVPPVAVAVNSEAASLSLAGGPISYVCIDFTNVVINGSAQSAHAVVDLGGFQSPFKVVPVH